MEKRVYKVANAIFEVRLEEPWSFMGYGPVVSERIRRAADGGIGLEILPTRAGDKEPHRTLIQTREEVLPEALKPGILDLSQYEPFLYEGKDKPDFTITLKTSHNTLPELGRKLIRIDSQQPFYTIYDNDGAPRITLDEHPDTGIPCATLCMNSTFTEGEVYPAAGIRKSSVVFNLSTALMMMFTYSQATKGKLLIHASTVRHLGKANIFLGQSGTGKSTHSHLWLEHIEGAELLNDDNPVVAVENGVPMVYGTPWSGKTPCYRNTSAQIRAIVRLEQAPENSISPNKGLSAFTAFVGSVSSIRWNRPIMDCINSTAEQIVLACGVYTLRCRPDREAAETCCKAIESSD